MATQSVDALLHRLILREASNRAAAVCQHLLERARNSPCGVLSSAISKKTEGMGFFGSGIHSQMNGHALKMRMNKFLQLPNHRLGPA